MDSFDITHRWPHPTTEAEYARHFATSWNTIRADLRKKRRRGGLRVQWRGAATFGGRYSPCRLPTEAGKARPLVRLYASIRSVRDDVWMASRYDGRVAYVLAIWPFAVKLVVIALWKPARKHERLGIRWTLVIEHQMPVVM